MRRRRLLDRLLRRERVIFLTHTEELAKEYAEIASHPNNVTIAFLNLIGGAASECDWRVTRVESIPPTKLLSGALQPCWEIRGVPA